MLFFTLTQKEDFILSLENLSFILSNLMEKLKFEESGFVRNVSKTGMLALFTVKYNTVRQSLMLLEHFLQSDLGKDET